MWCLEILHLLFPRLLDAHIRGRTNMGDYSQFNQAVTKNPKKETVCMYSRNSKSFLPWTGTSCSHQVPCLACTLGQSFQWLSWVSSHTPAPSSLRPELPSEVEIVEMMSPTLPLRLGWTAGHDRACMGILSFPQIKRTGRLPYQGRNPGPWSGNLEF